MVHDQLRQDIKLFQAPRKNVLPSILDTSLDIIVDDVKLAEISNNTFVRNNVTF